MSNVIIKLAGLFFGFATGRIVLLFFFEAFVFCLIAAAGRYINRGGDCIQLLYVLGVVVFAILSAISVFT